jgi:hypothetical protein
MAADHLSSGVFAALVRLFLLSSARRTAFEIGEAGERAVALQLHASGYRVHRDTQGPGATDIVAAGNGRRLLVQVKGAQSPTPPGGASPEEGRRIRVRAARLGAEPWEARVQLNWWLEPVAGIGWRLLN